MICSALTGPMRRARNYSSHPGKRLNRTSGKPNRALFSAMITEQDRAASRPPPRASPSASEIVVNGQETDYSP